MTPSSGEISSKTQTSQGTVTLSPSYDKAVIGIGLSCGAGFAILIILTTLAYGLPNSGSLLFGEDSSRTSLEDEKTNLIITNLLGTSLKILHFEALEEIKSFKISSLGLFDVETGSKISSKQILFNGSNPFSINEIEPKRMVNINFNTSNENAGLYRGNFHVIMNGNSTLVPATYEVKSNHWLIYVWVFNGIVVSVVALNLIGYYFLVKEQDAVRLEAVSKINELIEYIQDPVTQEALPSATNYLTRTISKLQQSKPKSAKGDLMKINTLVKGTEAEAVDQTARSLPQSKEIPPELLKNEYSKIFEEYKTRLEEKIDFTFKLSNYATPNVIEKNIVSGITGIAFGIVVGFMPLVGGDYISSITGIYIAEVLILFGLGVAVGSLNEAIAKIWETSEDGKNDEPIEPPKIIGRKPTPGKEDVTSQVEVQVLLNRRMKDSTITKDTFTLRESKSKENVEADIIKDKNIQLVTLKPTSDLEKGKTYIITVSKKVKDQMGNNMGSDEIWMFHTAAQ